MFGTPSVFTNPTELRLRLGLLVAAVAATQEYQFRG
jgi:hypothetical protein